MALVWRQGTVGMMALWHACTSKLACSDSVAHRLSTVRAMALWVGAWLARREEHRCRRGRAIDDLGRGGSHSMAVPPYYGLPNGRAARCGSARAVELVAAWAGGLCFSRLRRYQAPNAAPSLNTQPGNPRSDLSSCTCAARATTPADGATAVCCRPT